VLKLFTFEVAKDIGVLPFRLLYMEPHTTTKLKIQSYLGFRIMPSRAFTCHHMNTKQKRMTVSRQQHRNFRKPTLISIA